MRWQHYWARQDPVRRPTNFLGALKIAKELGTFPSIAILLLIYAKLPVTTATSERSFNALKYSNNYLRSTMSDNRLNRLAFLYVHRDSPLNFYRRLRQEHLFPAVLNVPDERIYLTRTNLGFFLVTDTAISGL